ncbi:MAG: hypothetical protein XXXJIFNMEKO3_01465 [Candidatus Erwinia impunctatus]|nr:hypothetical protein XXXJIFNMEKO_01465 [Culicoides impunctatus]
MKSQGETARLRSGHKPALIWALTPYDLRLTQDVHYDAAVQRFVGESGDTWGSMLVMDEKERQRMVNWLGAALHKERKWQRITQRSLQIKRELDVVAHLIWPPEQR